MSRRHIISLLMENEAGALSRVAGLFSARAYNIESLTVAPTEDATLSRMTIVTVGSEDIIEQITKQLNKLVDVIKVMATGGNLTPGSNPVEAQFDATTLEAIVARRATRPFKDLAELEKAVPGLDAKLLESKKRMIFFQ